MSVNDDPKKYPWLTKEKKFIEKSLKEDKIVIGICLGAQLISNVIKDLLIVQSSATSISAVFWSW